MTYGSPIQGFQQGGGLKKCISKMLPLSQVDDQAVQLATPPPQNKLLSHVSDLQDETGNSQTKAKYGGPFHLNRYL